MKLRIYKAADGFHYLQILAPLSESGLLQQWITIDRHWYESSAIDDMNKRLQREREYKEAFKVGQVIAEGEV